MSRPTPRVHLALFIAQSSFAGFAVVGKAVLGEVDPKSVAALRILVSTPILFAIAFWLERHVPARRDIPVLILLGILGAFLNQLLFIFGLELTTATNVSILVLSIPVFTVGLAALMRVETLNGSRVWGIGWAIVGAVVLLDPFSMEISARTRWGNALILVNCLSYAAFLVLQRPVLQRIPPWTLTAWSFLFGGLGILAVCGRSFVSTSWSAFPPWVFWGLAYVAIVPTALGHALMSWSIRRSTSSVAAAYTTLQPLIAGVLAVLFLGESLGWKEGAGFLLIVLGLRLVSRPVDPTPDR